MKIHFYKITNDVDFYPEAVRYIASFDEVLDENLKEVLVIKAFPTEYDVEKGNLENYKVEELKVEVLTFFIDK